jgi:hypothetical protein
VEGCGAQTVNQIQDQRDEQQPNTLIQGTRDRKALQSMGMRSLDGVWVRTKRNQLRVTEGPTDSVPASREKEAAELLIEFYFR